MIGDRDEDWGLGSKYRLLSTKYGGWLVFLAQQGCRGVLWGLGTDEGEGAAFGTL